MSEVLVYGDGCEMCEYTPGAYYQHANDCGDDEDGTPNLCSGSGVHETDCRGEWLPCPGCSDVATYSRAASGGVMRRGSK